jgi:hypothetical protein
VAQIRALYRDTDPAKVLPDAGRFTVYKGQTAGGIIDGHQVRLTILSTGETQWVIDGVTLPDEPTNADIANSGLNDVTPASNGLMIGKNVCHVDALDKCEKWIDPGPWNSDGSTSFQIALRAAANSWVSDPAGLAMFRKTNRCLIYPMATCVS